MSKLNRAEFAAICHTTKAIVTTNISRKKIVEENNEIDTENPINKYFFEKQIKKLKKEKPIATEKLYEELVHRKTKKPLGKLKKDKTDYNGDQEVVDWDKRKKKAEALLKERQAEKELLNVKKMYGEMLPTEFIKSLFSNFTITVFSVLDNSTMNLAGVFCDELAGGDREALSRINQRLSEELQTIYDDAQDIAKKDIKNQIKEYSVKRGKGQNK